MSDTYTCPEGHTSTAGDYCDVCGSPIAVTMAMSSAPTPPAPAPGGAVGADGAALRACPHCGAEGPADALFCEDCGYDFTTGTPPPPPSPPTGDLVLAPPPPAPPPGPLEWVAELWVDPDWYATQDSDEPCPSAGAPAVVPLRERSVLVGRHSASRNIHPEIDCGVDSGVSRRHAQLTTDGQRWWVEDLRSANGTYVGTAGAPLPTDPIDPDQRRELADDERVYLGAWTRLVVRRATPDEQGS